MHACMQQCNAVSALGTTYETQSGGFVRRLRGCRGTVEGVRNVGCMYVVGWNWIGYGCFTELPLCHIRRCVIVPSDAYRRILLL